MDTICISCLLEYIGQNVPLHVNCPEEHHTGLFRDRYDPYYDIATGH